MGFERMRIPLLRNFSSATSVPGSSRSRAKNKPRNPSTEPSQSRPTAARTFSENTTSVIDRQVALPLAEEFKEIEDIQQIHIALPEPESLHQYPQPTLLTPQPSTYSYLFHSNSSNRHDHCSNMPTKIWVKRPGASPTRVEIADDDLVDNVRDAILNKYANSLGRSIDSPDITLKIVSRETANRNVPTERVLGPEESIIHTLETFYPGGQTIEEALLIDVLQRRTPRASPRPGNHHMSYYVPEGFRPDDAARDYFPPMPIHSPHSNLAQHANNHPSIHSMAVLTTGQLPALPSPGTHGTRRSNRPRFGRQHTSSPTIVHTQQPPSNLIDPKAQLNGAASVAPMPTPPAPSNNDHKPSITPPNRTSSPHGQRPRKKKIPNTRSVNGDPPPHKKPASASFLDGTVPPINVLIVEDNVINLKLLEAFMKRLKVRWKSAMNGKEAVATWRTGGFHLVLMDIQLPVMNGLEATKEIRRLEAVNGIGVFGGTPVATENKALCNGGDIGKEDALPDRNLFKSPVIIVALTASSLQSDRHEALAAGCNDFLTKPVNFVWMERKVTEWGCMQALIDFDGWRKWKEYAIAKENEDPAKKAAEEKEEKAKAKAALKAMFAKPPPSSSSSSSIPRDERQASNTSTESATNTAATSVTTTSPNSNPPIAHNVNGIPKKSASITSKSQKMNRSMDDGGI